jgi:hypothetical protein
LYFARTPAHEITNFPADEEIETDLRIVVVQHRALAVGVDETGLGSGLWFGLGKDAVEIGSLVGQFVNMARVSAGVVPSNA